MTRAANLAEAAGSGFAFRNRIINGAMMIDQRGSTGGYSADRFITYYGGGGVFSASNTTASAPAGFTNASILTVTTPDSSIAASDYYLLRQSIEGLNCSDLAWGTASAATVTLSFWVRSSVTGTFAGGLGNSAANRSYVFTYTINSSNTWEYKTVTITGDTSGTWLTTNGIGIMVSWDLGSGSNNNGTAGSWAAGDLRRTSGSVNWIATNGATFYITGVQLEKATTATPFEFRPYGAELALCQRYYLTGRGYSGLTSGEISGSSYYPVKMRGAPTIVHTYSAGAGGVLTGSDTSDSDIQWWKSNASSNFYRFTYTASAEL